MGETICIINSKVCPYNVNGFCIATKEDLMNALDKEVCSNQGRR